MKTSNMTLFVSVSRTLTALALGAASLGSAQTIAPPSPSASPPTREDKLLVQRVSTDGVGVNFTPQEPRSIIRRNTFSF